MSILHISIWSSNMAAIEGPGLHWVLWSSVVIFLHSNTMAYWRGQRLTTWQTWTVSDSFHSKHTFVEHIGAALSVLKVGANSGIIMNITFFCTQSLPKIEMSKTVSHQHLSYFSEVHRRNEHTVDSRYGGAVKGTAVRLFPMTPPPSPASTTSTVEFELTNINRMI